MKYIRGFLMAWGMFCWIPCPYKQWREEDRLAQIGMFPLVGTFIGLILCLCWWILSYIGAGMIITGCLMTGIYFLLTGFIHMDGFMDCSDAIMPRHPDMEKRRRILKDSHVGAFAVICLAMMLAIFTGAMIEIADGFSIKGCCLLVVLFTTSRFMSALEVLMSEPMETSQYAKAPAGTWKDVIPAFVIMLVVLGCAEWLISGGSWWSLIAELYSNAVFVVVVIVALVTARNDIKKLGGMNGDISGHLITMSELFGLICMALIMR